MNTYIFHTNSDYETNSRASQRIGNLRARRWSTGGLIKGFGKEDYSMFSRQPDEVKCVGDLKMEKRNEPAIPPEDFGKLKRGGDGTCEAVVFWLSHQFAVNKN